MLVLRARWTDSHVATIANIDRKKINNEYLYWNVHCFYKNGLVVRIVSRFVCICKFKMVVFISFINIICIYTFANNITTSLIVIITIIDVAFAIAIAASRTRFVRQIARIDQRIDARRAELRALSHRCRRTMYRELDRVMLFFLISVFIFFQRRVRRDLERTMCQTMVIWHIVAFKYNENVVCCRFVKPVYKT